MAKKQSKYNTRKDIFKRMVFPASEMIRLVVKDHQIWLSTNKLGHGYWIKKDQESWDALNNKALLCKVFKDHLISIGNINEIKNALFN